MKFVIFIGVQFVVQSHPSRVRGLKLRISGMKNTYNNVAPFTGAWIEIAKKRIAAARSWRRTLHGCVD